MKKIIVIGIILLVSVAVYFYFPRKTVLPVPEVKEEIVVEEPIMTVPPVKPVDKPLGALGCKPANTFLIEMPTVYNSDANSALLRNDDSLNDELLTVARRIDQQQDIYFSKNNSYFQGLKTHTSAPLYGTHVQADKLTRKPERGQKENWVDFSAFNNASLPFAVEVNKYKTAKNECGYVITFTIEKDEREYIKILGRGPTAEHDSYDWVLNEI